jgi:beta-N-acetylhexosaminidase
MEEKNDNKSEYLNEEKIRTMQRDIARLRGIKIQKERKRVDIFLKPEEEMVVVEKKPLIKEVVLPPLEKISIEEKEVVEVEVKPHFPPPKVPKIKKAEEAKRKKEEEEKERENRLKKREKFLSERRLQLQKELSLIPKKREPFEQEKSQLLAEIEKIKREKLSPILTKEKEIEEEKKLVEEEEKEAPFEKKEEIEKKRWQIEQKRQEIEEEKWGVEEEIIEIQEKINEVDLKIEELEEEAEKLKEECQNIINEEEAIDLLKKKVNLENEFKLVEDQRLTLEVKAETLIQKESETKRVLKEILESERALEEEIMILEQKETSITDPRERKEIEKRRWNVEQKRKDTEEKKWQTIKRQEEEKQEVEKIQFEIEKFKKREEELAKKLEQIDISLKKLKEEGVKIEDLIPLIMEAPQPKKKFPEPEEEIAPPPKPPPRPEKIPEAEKPVKIEEITEKEGEEIGKEEEAEKIKKRIKELEELKPFFPPVTPPGITISKPPPERPKPFLKILIRGIILIFFLLALGGFLYWFFWIRKPPPEEPFIPPPEEKIEREEPEKIIKETEIIFPLISVKETKVIEISKIEETSGLLSQLMEEELPFGTFTQIVIKNISENRLASLEDLSLAFQIEVPKEIFEKLESDYTLSIYSQKQGKRIALIGKIKKEEEILEILKNWEKKIKKEGILISGKKIPVLVPYFKTAFYKDIAIHYLTISKDDLGICYVCFDNYFILTSSFESIKKVIDKIRVQEIEKKIGQLFIIGFEEKTITPSLKEIFKKYRPGGVLLLSKNIENEGQLKSLIESLQELSLKETDFSLFVAVDQEGGPISRIGFLTEKTPQSKIEDTETAYQIGLARAKELKKLRVNLNLAPVLDVANERDFLFERTFQKRPEEIGQLAKSLISGQREIGILTAIKHFPGYGGISFNPEEELANLEKIPEISQFKKAMESKPEFVITSNAIYQEVDSSLPFTFSPFGIQFLKKNLGSEVLVICDDLAQNSLLEKFTLKEIVTKPILAGVDILIFSGRRESVEEALETFYQAYQNGEIPEEKINEAVSRIIKLKQKLIK